VLKLVGVRPNFWRQSHWLCLSPIPIPLPPTRSIPFPRHLFPPGGSFLFHGLAPSVLGLSLIALHHSHELRNLSAHTIRRTQASAPAYQPNSSAHALLYERVVPRKARTQSKLYGDDHMLVSSKPQSEKNAHHRADYREGDDRLRSAAMKVLRSSSYSALRRLKCEGTGAVIAVHGVLPSYYLKQMAQSAIQRLEGIRGVTNLVEVQATHPV